MWNPHIRATSQLDLSFCYNQKCDHHGHSELGQIQTILPVPSAALIHFRSSSFSSISYRSKVKEFRVFARETTPIFSDKVFLDLKITGLKVWSIPSKHQPEYSRFSISYHISKITVPTHTSSRNKLIVHIHISKKSQPLHQPKIKAEIL